MNGIGRSERFTKDIEDYLKEMDSCGDVNIPAYMQKMIAAYCGTIFTLHMVDAVAERDRDWKRSLRNSPRITNKQILEKYHKCKKED